MGKSEGIKVIVRTRPFEGSHSTTSGGITRLGINITGTDDPEAWMVSTIKANVSKPQKYKTWGFNFIFWSGYNYKKFTFQHDEDDKEMISTMMANHDRIFCSQKRVYELCGIPIREDMKTGKPVIIFAFGLSGSGKTYTTFGLDKDDNPQSWFQMNGPDDPSAGDQWGLFPRLAWDFYEEKKLNKGTTIQLVFMQNVVNDVFDLLGGGTTSVSSMRTDKGGFCFHPGFMNAPCPEFKDLCEIFRAAASRKQIAPTQFNPQSTRGHVVVVFIVVQPDGTEGRFYVCDLAGAEPAAEVAYYDYKFDADGEVVSKRPRPGPDGAKKTKMLQSQGKKINLSLGELQSVFDKMKKQIKKKQKIRIIGVSTWIMKFLKTSLPKSSVYLICALRPECGFSPGDPGSSQPEWTQFERMTIQTLDFGKSASAIKTKAVSLKSGKITQKDLDAAKAAADAAESKAAELEAKIKELMAGGAGGGGGGGGDVEAALAAARAEWETQQEAIDDHNDMQMNAEMNAEMSAAKDELSAMKEKEAKQIEQQNAAFTKRGMKYLGMLSLEEMNTASEVPHLLHIDLDPFQSRRWMVEVNEGTSVIGRKSGEIKLFSTKVMGAEHAKIVRTGDTVRVVAMNGPTWVNGRKVAPSDPMTLQPNDRVSLGGEVLLFRMPGAIDAPYRVLATDGATGDDDGMVPNESGDLDDGDMSYEAEEALGKESHLQNTQFNSQVMTSTTPAPIGMQPKVDKDHLMAEVRAAYATTLEAQQICAELGRGHLKFEVAMTTDIFTHTPLAGITIIDPTSSLEVVMTADEFDIAISQVRDGHKMVMIHIDMGDDFVLPDEYDPSVAFFQRPTKIAQAHAHWAALYYGMGLPDEGEDYEEIVLRTPKIATDASGGVLRYRWTLSEGTDEDEFMTRIDGINPPSEGGNARSWLDTNWPFELEILSAQNLPVMCKEAWVEFEMNGEMREAPAHFVMDDPELHGKNMPTSSPIFSDAKMPYKTDFGENDVDEDLADWLDKIGDGGYGVPLVVMGLPFVRVPDDKIAVVGGVFQNQPIQAKFHSEKSVHVQNSVAHPDYTHDHAEHMPGGSLSILQDKLSEAEAKLKAEIAKEQKITAEFAAYKAANPEGGGGCCTIA